MNRVQPSSPRPATPRTLAAFAALGEWAARPDAELLDRFVRYDEHPAFEEILRRHGPLVLGICRRTLANPADVDDAFQSTFLVLLRKARTVARGDQLGPWLYGVAYRVARKARDRAARRPTCAPETAAMIPDPTPPAADPNDWLPALDAELTALPARYRDPLVLCDLQGLSRKAAADQLRVREGTLSSRLARGRDLLRRRLIKYGTLLPAGGVGVLLGVGGAVPAALHGRTADLIAALMHGGSPAGVVPAGVAQLTDEVTRHMLLNKLRIVGTAAVAAAVVAVGLAGAAGPEVTADKPGAKPAGVPAATPTATAAPAGPAAPARTGSDAEQMEGVWAVERFDLPPQAVADPKTKEQVAAMVRSIRLVVHGGTWWIVQGGIAGRSRPRLDPTKNPKWLDDPGEKLDPGRRTAMRGIYRLTADTLEFCTVEDEKAGRPAEFEASDDPATMVLAFRRAKGPDVPADQQKARAQLLGAWASTKDPTARVEFTPVYVFIRPAGGAEWAAYTYTLDPTRNPMRIDLEPVGEAGPRLSYGIYELGPSGGLRLCIGEGVKRVARPLEFDSPGKVLCETLVREDGLNKEVGLKK
ncbi:MAG: sigE 29 [Gemmataceae bacterium]|nr:sigE 29 [Gemmataceae bacterium]